MRLLLAFLVALIVGGCASAPEPGFKPTVFFRSAAGGGCELEFRREEIARPHGFNPWPFPSVVEVSSFMSLPLREGDIPVSNISMRDSIGTNLLQPWKAHRGHVVLSEGKAAVEIFERGDDGVWRALELNGTYQTVAK